jgi:hypothetical protein
MSDDYVSQELSAQDGAPIMLFEFIRGTTTWRYAAFPIDVVSDGDTFTSVPGLTCGTLMLTGKPSQQDQTVKLPLTNALAITFMGIRPDKVTTMTIFRCHYGFAARRVMWDGFITDSSIDLDGVTLTGKTQAGYSQTQVSNSFYQRNCTNQFGGPGCFVDLDALGVAFWATGAVGSVVTIPSLSGSWVRGTLEYADIRSTIMSETATTVTLIRPIVQLITDMAENPETPAAVTLCQGCDKSIATCATHNNVGNHSGCPGIRYKSPFDPSQTVFT